MAQEKNMSVMLLQVGKYSFRSVVNDDCDTLLRWRNLDQVRLMSFNSDKISYEDHLAWFKKMMMDDTKKYFIFTIDQEAVGIVSFFKFDQKNKSAYWSFHLGDVEVPRGTGTEMCRLGVALAKDYLKIKILNAEVIEANVKSIKIHEALSFEKIHHSCQARDGKSYLTYRVYL